MEGGELYFSRAEMTCGDDGLAVTLLERLFLHVPEVGVGGFGGVGFAIVVFLMFAALLLSGGNKGVELFKRVFLWEMVMLIDGCLLLN